MERLERLLNLIAALLDTERPLTAEELGSRVPGYPATGTPTFKRAFERDKASLRSMGVPLDVIEIEPSNPESPIGYRVRPERYDLPDPGLDPEEVAALHLAATQVRLEGADSTVAIWKLGGISGRERVGGLGGRERVGGLSGRERVGGREPETDERQALPGSDHLPVLFGALADRAAVTFGYRGSRRTLDPWRIEFRNGSWYVVGRDHDRDDRRAFRLDRVDGPVEVGVSGAFVPPASTGGVSTHPWEVGDEDPIDVQVLVDADHAVWALANADGAGQLQADGSALLTLRVTHRAGLRSWVLNFLDRAEIVGPPDERAAMIAWLENVPGRERGPGLSGRERGPGLSGRERGHR